MIARIATTEGEFRNTHPGIKKMFVWIDESLKESQAELSHLLVDGIEIRETPFEYVKLHHKNISVVEVVTCAKKKVRNVKKSAKSTAGTASDVLTVRISNLTFTINKYPTGLDELFILIEEAMNEFQVYFSHLVVDGSELTADNPRQFLEENLATIQEIEARFLTSEQYFQQVVEIVDDFLLHVAPTLNELADEFYGKPDDDTWGRLEATINGINSMLGIINSMIALPELFGKTEAFAELGESIGLHLENLKNALQLSDYTLVADILRFELLAFLEELHSAVGTLVGRHTDVAH